MYIHAYPQFKIWLRVEEVFNVNLMHRGSYAIRIRFPEYDETAVKITHDTIDSSESVSLLPAEVTQNVATSRYVPILYLRENLKLGDVFCIDFNYQKRIDHDIRPILNITLDLAFRPRNLTTELPVLEGDPKYLCTRKLSLKLRMDSSIHLHRTVTFDNDNSLAVCLSIHAALVGILTRKKVDGPEPIISAQLRHCHHLAVQSLMATIHSLQTFIQKYSSLIESVIFVPLFDLEGELEKVLNTIQTEPLPWSSFERDASTYSTKTQQLFGQVLQLFKNSKQLNESLHKTEMALNIKRLGEGFVYWEDSTLSLGSNSEFEKMHEMVVKKIGDSKYWKSIPRLQLHCEEIDQLFPKGCIILEHIFLPVSTEESESGVSSGSDLISLESDQISMLAMLDEGGAKFKRICSEPKLDALAISEFNPTRSISDYQFTNTKECDLSTTCSISSRSSLKKCAKTKDLISKLGQEDDDLLAFTQNKENLKLLLRNIQFEGVLYSESNSVLSSKISYFTPNIHQQYKFSRNRADTPAHLVVLVHGLKGNSHDLAMYKNFLIVSNPHINYAFLDSCSIENKTWSDLNELGRHLLSEVIEMFREIEAKKVSIISHSLGSIIVRSMFNNSRINEIYPHLHTFMSLNSPHTSLMYADTKTSWGINFFSWLKQSDSMKQLVMRDQIKHRSSFMYNLSTNKAFASFKYVLLVGNFEDHFVPAHSALIEHCEASKKDISSRGRCYHEMIQHINQSILNSPKHTTLVKYIVTHCSQNYVKIDNFIGRGGHLASVEDEFLIQKLMFVSAGKYFI